MAPAGKRIGGFDDPSSWKYTPDEQRALTNNLVVILGAVHGGKFRNRSVDVDLLCELHRAIFDGVRSHAGRPRSPDFGEQYLSFGPNTSSHRSAVPSRMISVLTATEKKLTELAAAGNGKSDAYGAIETAVKCHADLIEIHPFQDGNGRSTRALMSAILVRCGFRPIPIEVPRQEYESALNLYFQKRDLQVLVDLCIQLYPLR